MPARAAIVATAARVLAMVIGLLLPLWRRSRPAYTGRASRPYPFTSAMTVVEQRSRSRDDPSSPHKTSARAGRAAQDGVSRGVQTGESGVNAIRHSGDNPDEEGSVKEKRWPRLFLTQVTRAVLMPIHARYRWFY